jgi:hypothetical protein
MWALAAELTGAWPGEIAERGQTEIYLAAQLQHRLYKERNTQ